MLVDVNLLDNCARAQYNKLINKRGSALTLPQHTVSGGVTTGLKNYKSKNKSLLAQSGRLIFLCSYAFARHKYKRQKELSTEIQNLLS